MLVAFWAKHDFSSCSVIFNKSFRAGRLGPFPWLKIIRKLEKTQSYFPVRQKIMGDLKIKRTDTSKEMSDKQSLDPEHTCTHPKGRKMAAVLLGSVGLVMVAEVRAGGAGRGPPGQEMRC